MSFSNLTTSGWVFFAWTLAWCTGLIASIATGQRKKIEVQATGAALCIAWLVWLLS